MKKKWSETPPPPNGAQNWKKGKKIKKGGGNKGKKPKEKKGKPGTFFKKKAGEPKNLANPKSMAPPNLKGPPKWNGIPRNPLAKLGTRKRKKPKKVLAKTKNCKLGKV
eukprot:UN3198